MVAAAAVVAEPADAAVVAVPPRSCPNWSWSPPAQVAAVAVAAAVEGTDLLREYEIPRELVSFRGFLFRGTTTKAAHAATTLRLIP